MNIEDFIITNCTKSALFNKPKNIIFNTIHYGPSKKGHWKYVKYCPFDGTGFYILYLTKKEYHKLIRIMLADSRRTVISNYIRKHKHKRGFR